MVPQDADNSTLLTFNPPWTLTGVRTQYVCQAFDMGTVERQVVAVEINNAINPGSPLVHHMLMHSCGNDINQLRENFVFDTKPYPCQAGARLTLGQTVINVPPGLLSEGTSPVVTCDTLMFGAAQGRATILYPPDVGIPIGKVTRYLVIELHIDNPQNLKDVVINDVVKVYTTTKLRKYNGGTLVVGDPLALMGKMPQNNGTTDKLGTCTAACTENFKTPITVVSSFLHMHKYGREIYITKKSKETGNTSVMDYREFYDFGFQITVPMKFVVNKGDELNVHCKYNTRTDTVEFGSGSHNEMCMDFLLYYPLESAFKLCGYSPYGTICGGTTNYPIRNIFEPNPVPDPVGMGIQPFGIYKEIPALAPTQKSGAMGTTVLGIVMTGALFSILL